MKPMHLLALLLLPGLAGAAPRGETAFKTACASCHYAAPVTPKGDKGVQSRARGDRRTNAAELMTRSTPKKLRTWLAAPQKVRPGTRCDTRLLKPDEVGAVLSFLAASSQPAMTREEVMQRELQQETSRTRQKAHPAQPAPQPRTESTTSPSEGKK